MALTTLAIMLLPITKSFISKQLHHQAVKTHFYFWNKGCAELIVGSKVHFPCSVNRPPNDIGRESFFDVGRNEIQIGDWIVWFLKTDTANGVSKL